MYGFAKDTDAIIGLLKEIAKARIRSDVVHCAILIDTTV